MKKYLIDFDGWVEVDAENRNEAITLFLEWIDNILKEEEKIKPEFEVAMVTEEK